MTVTELIGQLEAIRAEHGENVLVVARRYGDYLASGPSLHLEKRVRYPSNDECWTERDPDWLEDEAPLVERLVAFIEH
jgi:hypothetical protein